MATCFNCTHGMDCLEHAPRDHGFAAVDRHPQSGLFDGARPVRWFDDRAAAVRHARRRSEAGVPCDVRAADGSLVYAREMDVDATRAQRDLF
jgi:hypothetical protein